MNNTSGWWPSGAWGIGQMAQNLPPFVILRIVLWFTPISFCRNPFCWENRIQSDELFSNHTKVQKCQSSRMLFTCLLLFFSVYNVFQNALFVLWIKRRQLIHAKLVRRRKNPDRLIDDEIAVRWLFPFVLGGLIAGRGRWSAPVWGPWPTPVLGFSGQDGAVGQHHWKGIPQGTAHGIVLLLHEKT